MNTILFLNILKFSLRFISFFLKVWPCLFRSMFLNLQMNISFYFFVNDFQLNRHRKHSTVSKFFILYGHLFFRHLLWRSKKRDRLGPLENIYEIEGFCWCCQYFVFVFHKWDKLEKCKMLMAGRGRVWEEKWVMCIPWGLGGGRSPRFCWAMCLRNRVYCNKRAWERICVYVGNFFNWVVGNSQIASALPVKNTAKLFHHMDGRDW